MNIFKRAGMSGENPPRPQSQQDKETIPLPPLVEVKKETKEELLRKLPADVREHLIEMYLANIPEESSQALTLQLQIWAKAGIEVSSEQLFAARETAEALKEELKMVAGKNADASTPETKEMGELRNVIEAKMPDIDQAQQ
ncbi:MAG: hypothetical protein KBD16_00915 [Candidatus Pacebacteria bacterium]|nr:hypothetical protein [Candidatus Paceibacterota bacterium]